MSTVVELGVLGGFTLDHPEAGILDNIEFPLGGIDFVDISNKMITIRTTRGKNRDLEVFDTGRTTIRLNNDERDFDPNYSLSPYSGNIVPRRPVRITTDGERVFTGTVDDWNFDYQPGGASLAEIVASDDFTIITNQLLESGTATPQLTGARVSAVLDMPTVAWPADKRNIDVGRSVLGADTFDGNALSYLQQIETSEQGQLFMSKTGVFTFRDRFDATPTSSSLVTFADDGTGVPYTRVNVNYGTELLFNQVVFTSAVGSATASNEFSQTQYGIRTTEVSTLVNSQDQLDLLADYFVQRFAAPEYRFSGINMNLDTMTGPHLDSVLALELGDVVLIKFTPNNIGSAIEQYGQIIALDHDVDGVRHDMRIGLSGLDWNFLVLDDAVFGTMNVNHLAF
tara:strand:+ start:4988 stop:6178 length:1191 start_codon:yes stop_codon:yes gene_type:complete